jgi:Transcription factor TFIIB repeat
MESGRRGGCEATDNTDSDGSKPAKYLSENCNASRNSNGDIPEPETPSTTRFRPHHASRETAPERYHEPHPDDPFVTPGFITAFRMLAPLREPVYSASARTMNGALAEMERVLGDVLYDDNTLCNSRSPVAEEEPHTVIASQCADARALDERWPSIAQQSSHCAGPTAVLGSTAMDARNALVAYFQILDLANILDVDQETAYLAVRMFRHISATSVCARNKSVEILAAACLRVATEHRSCDHQHRNQSNEFIPRLDPLTSGDVGVRNGPDIPADTKNSSETTASALNPPDPASRSVPRSTSDVALAADIDPEELERYVKLVNVAIGAAPGDSAASVARQIPTYCKALEMDDRVAALATAIAENAFNLKLCSRRNAQSVGSAAIYMSCLLHGIRRTQVEIARETKVTEVTLRKVHKELTLHLDRIIPPSFQSGNSRPLRALDVQRGRRASRGRAAAAARRLRASGETLRPHSINHRHRANDMNQSEKCGKMEMHSASREEIQLLKVEQNEMHDIVPHSSGHDIGSSDHRTTGFEEPQPNSGSGNDPDASTRENQPQQLLLAMMQNPDMVRAVASAMALMPSLIAPPPLPPPLPSVVDVAVNTVSRGDNNSRPVQDEARTRAGVCEDFRRSDSSDGSANCDIEAPQAVQKSESLPAVVGTGATENPFVLLSSILRQVNGTTQPGQLSALPPPIPTPLIPIESSADVVGRNQALPIDEDCKNKLP